MATILISGAILVHPAHTLHLTKVDIAVEKGKIAQVAKKITGSFVREIDAKGYYVSPGFFDLNANFGVPGYETKEDIFSGVATAAAGGFTGLALQPNTDPSLHSRSQVALIVNAAKGQPVDILPVGAVSKHRKGEELAELYDMKLAGAVAFGDGDHSVQQAGLLSRALLYAKGIEALVVSFAQDLSLAGGHPMNEGEVSTYLGMKGTPNLAESVMIARDLSLAEYHDARIHFTTISTPESVEIIKRAKAKGVKVTCDIASHHLLFSDEDVKTFDSNYRVNPPLRSRANVKSLRKAVKDGVIDAIVSQHTPHEVEFKNVEFQIAKDGISSLQTVLPIVLESGFSVEQIVDKLAIKPREILGLTVPQFIKGESANLVLFSTEEEWTLDKTSNRSKGQNNPLFGQKLKGKVLAIVNNNQVVENKI